MRVNSRLQECEILRFFNVILEIHFPFLQIPPLSFVCRSAGDRAGTLGWQQRPWCQVLPRWGHLELGFAGFYLSCSSYSSVALRCPAATSIYPSRKSLTPFQAVLRSVSNRKIVTSLSDVKFELSSTEETFPPLQALLVVPSNSPWVVLS